ncbi:MAG: hypothetical protein A3B44_04130 [Candidatus Levybacteria bacterium RIFCSPLOWO2_01_FULL_38_21]|nr:MAG: hypothetical protein A3B44_04130 [Candidatus Levybacteria bacterium RIFCSPLOWO2_01_FULL_38_21]
MSKKEEKIIKDTTEELFKLLEIEGGIKVVPNEEFIDIVLDTKDSGIVIGRHGDILESLQLILSMVISRKLGKFLRILLEVGDYKKNREEWLKSIAKDAKDQVVKEGREITLLQLKPWERRVVHITLKDDEEVVSESVGEGRDRVLIVRPKS